MQNYFPEISSSFKMFIFNDYEFILKRVINDVEDYYYCTISENSCRSKAIRGRIKEGTISFDRQDFHYEMKLADLDKLECRTLA